MLVAVRGHYDGTKIVMDEKLNLAAGQEVIITILDARKKKRKNIDLSKYVGRGEKMFNSDADAVNDKQH